MKRSNFELQYNTIIQDKEVYVIAQASGYYHPGRPNGPIEFSSPPEGECELSHIKIYDQETNEEVFQFESLSKSDQTEIEEGLEESFWDSYNNVQCEY